MKRILVIEDNQSLLKDVLEMLGFEGYEAIGAENGIVGVQRAREFRPDLIICDIMMPGLDGFGVLEELRKDVSLATIPFIFLTARTERSDSRYGMELGADDYLTKPFTADELLKTLNARLSKREQFDTISELRLAELRGNIILALPHELRTPLNVILGFSDLLMSDASMMDAVRISDMARHINTAGMRLYRLIENFLTYAQTELLMHDPVKRAALQHGNLIYPTISIENNARLKAQAVERVEDLHFDLEPVDGVGIAEEYLKKIIEELIDNAAKFSEAGTPITVTGHVEGDHYLICVNDKGRGMSPEQIENIGAYMQFDRKLYEQQGSGLGLVLSRRLVELHEGELTIESTPHESTTICVRLPVRQGGL